MALQPAFQDLCAQVEQLCDALRGLVTIIEDKPTTGGVALVDNLSNAALDTLGMAEEAVDCAGKAGHAVEPPTDIDRVRRALIECQENYNRIARLFSAELLHYDKMADLTGFGHKRKGEWQSWSETVKETIDRCQQPLFDLSQSLFRCWQEIAERVGTTSISVQTSNVGQKIRVSQESDLMREGIT